jgi:large subunit ribosomal protein LP0
LRTAIQHQVPTHPELKPLLKHVKGEIGLVFTNMDIIYIKKKIEAEKSSVAVKLNSRAPEDIILAMDGVDFAAEQISFFSALGIPMKRVGNKVQFIGNFVLYRKGELITESAVSLLNTLKLKPITKQAKIIYALCNGVILDEKILNSAEQQLEHALFSGIRNIAAISVAIGNPNQSSIMYIIRTGLSNVRAVSICLENSSPAEQVKERTEDGK